MLWMTTLAASTPIWVICTMLFVFGAGLGLIMQVIVLVVQNSVAPAMVGTATRTNNYFREVGASLGVAVFGTIFTTRLSDSLRSAFAGAGADPSTAQSAASSLDPATLNQLPEQLRTPSSGRTPTRWRRCSGTWSPSSSSPSCWP